MTSSAQPSNNTASLVTAGSSLQWSVKSSSFTLLAVAAAALLLLLLLRLGSFGHGRGKRPPGEIMASVRKIPYGYNPNYETVVKIIGSKYVRYLAEKPDGKAKKGGKAEIPSMLRRLPPHNTSKTHDEKPPGHNRALGQQINPGLEGEQQNKGDKEGHKSKQAETSSKKSDPPNAHCVTVPSGDKSLSYIHVFKNPSLGASMTTQQPQQDTAQELMETLENSDSLVNSLRKELELYPLSLTTLEKLQDDLKVFDPRASGLLPQAQLSHLLLKHETEMICQKHRLMLHPGMLEALVNNYEFGRRGRVRWKMFVEFLKKLQDGSDSAWPVCKRRNKEKNEGDSQDKGQHKPAFKSWEQVKSDTPASSDSEERDAWIDRFRKLERALYLSDVKNTGKLEKEKAKRLIHNYNQIYDLCLSPLKIDNAFRPFQPGQDIPLEPLLNYLKEL
ncbi:hypothetical protein lerEdw1_011732 [Lerista edwardsae]|nr:hypothetical protein lerEdw1_011732 [Lerista edwardsae]